MPSPRLVAQLTPMASDLAHRVGLLAERLTTTSACDDARRPRLMRRRPRDAIVCSIVCGLILLLLFAQPQSAAAGNVVSPQNRILKEKYAALRVTRRLLPLNASRVGAWRESELLARPGSARATFHFGFDTVHPRRFAKDGPLQVAAFLDKCGRSRPGIAFGAGSSSSPFFVDCSLCLTTTLVARYLLASTGLQSTRSTSWSQCLQNIPRCSTTLSASNGVQSLTHRWPLLASG